jgi:mRNA interferase YafQ
MLAFDFTNQFKKDLRLLEKRHYDLDELFDIVVKIIGEEPLPERCREHHLHGDFEGFTDCHVKGDWVILYYFDENGVIFSRTGTHADLL